MKLFTRKRLYAEIDLSKTEELDDGTLKVYGYASSGAVDSDGETITPECMKSAIPGYMKFGAVREMHQAIAAGTALEMSVEDATGKTWFGAHVVDPVAVKKVQTGTYKGFSIGGKVTKRDVVDKTIIHGLNLIEVSLVDRPANPEAVMTLVKGTSTAEDDVAELAELLDSGDITPAKLLELVKGYDPEAPEGGTGAMEPVGSEGGDPVAGTGSMVVPPQGGVPPEPVASLEPADKVEKGMYSVSSFATLLQSVGYLIQDTTWEAEYEGDSSPIPAALVKWLKAGLAIFTDMAAEETAELVACLTATAKAAGADDLQKAGSRFSKVTKAALGKIHGACKEAAAHLDGLNYNDDADKAELLDDTNGISTDEEAVTKAVSAAIAPLNEDLTKARKEITELNERLEKMKAMPAPGKALLKAVALTKSQDSNDEPPNGADNAPAEGTQARAVYEMNKIFKSALPLNPN